MNWNTLDTIRQKKSQKGSPPVTVASGDVEMTDKMRKMLEELGVSTKQLELIAS